MNLFYDTFKGFAEIGSDFTRKPYFGQGSDIDIEKRRQMGMAPGNNDHHAITPVSSERQVFGLRTARGFGRIFQAAARAPMKFTVAMAEGAHNAPRLWVDKSVRKPVKVTGIMSGISAGCQVSTMSTMVTPFESVVLIMIMQELLLGTYDGISGIVTLPILGAKEEGIIGFAKGIGQGIVGMPVKFWAGKLNGVTRSVCFANQTRITGMSGVTGYPMQGVDEQIKKAFVHDDMRDIRSSLQQLGRIECASLSDEEKEYIRDAWVRRQSQK